MKMHSKWITALFAVTFLCTMASGRQQEPQVLAPGFSQERTLGSGENHAYTITLQEGFAVIGEAVQHGVDLVIDIYGPDERLIRTVDSPNGKEGPEPIDLTVFTSGNYKLVIHTLETTASPGKYVIKIDSVLTVEQNGRRLAKKSFPPALQGLWHSNLNEPKAVEEFVASRAGKGPIIENMEGDRRNVRVTYLYYGDANTEEVTVSGGPHEAIRGLQMTRFLRSHLFFAEEIVPRDARYRYRFEVTDARFVGPKAAIKVSDERTIIDELNPVVLGSSSILTMPDAPPQPYLVKNHSVAQGKLAPASMRSNFLKEDRTLTVYTPPGYDGTKACDLLLVFDGEDYDGGGSGSTPTPTILDNLIAANKLSPTVAVFVNSMGNRLRDLTDYPPFADFIGTELVPWVRKNYRINPRASDVVVAGSSLGGLAASYCAFAHSDAIGNVLSLSGSYWITKDWQHRPPWPLPDETGDLVSGIRVSKRLPIKFYIAIGRFESGSSMLGTNRELRDVLLLKGYPITYREFNGGHDSIWWRSSLADGLLALRGR